MSLRMYGQYIIQTPAPAEDPVMVGTQWYDPNTATLKICTSVSPYTFSSQSLLVAHNLLSATHPDTSAASPVRGDLITAQGASPIWTRLPIGANHTVLRSDGVDTGWGAIVAGDLPANVAYIDQVENITGVYTFATDPVFNANAIPWAKVNKLTSSLADLATRSAADLTTGTLLAARMPALTGDVTTVAGAVATTLATVNANVGTFNNVTVNGKGLVTAASNVAYLTGNQTITLSGDISGSGATAITTTIGAGKVTNAMLAGSIAYSKLSLTGAILNADLAGSIAASKLVGTDIATVGTLTGGATGTGFTVALSTSTITGTLADARLSTNVPLLNGGNIFTGSNSFKGNGLGAVAQSLGFSNDASTSVLYAFGAAPGGAARTAFQLILADSAAGNAVVAFASDKNGNITLIGTANAVGTITSGIWNGAQVVSSGLVVAQGTAGIPASGSGVEIGGGATPTITVFNRTGGAYLSLLTEALSYQFGLSGSGGVSISGTALFPDSDNSWTIGKSGNRWSAVWATNGTIQTSDRRRKRAIVDSDLGLDFVLALRPKQFVMIDEPDTMLRYGLIAQDVIGAAGRRSVLGFVGQDQDGGYGLNYAAFVTPLISAVQQHEARIAALEAR